MCKNRLLYIAAGAISGLTVAVFLVYQYTRRSCFRSSNSSELNTPGAKPETVSRLIPPYAYGMVIGKCRQNITEIEDTSKARITVSHEPIPPHMQHRVVITGTRQQIEVAWAMISEIVLNATRKEKIASLSVVNKYVMNALGLHEGLVEVFVSAMENPSRFWIQVCGMRSMQLDDLVEQMSKFYAEPSNCVQCSLEKRLVLVGDLVASPYPGDKKWYRAKVMEVTENGNELTLFYVDYGDTAKIEKSDVLALDGVFLRLDFQAIQCRLENTIPKSGEWTDAAKKFFRKLCRVGEWKTLKAEIMNLHELKFEDLVLAVELYDQENGRSINISEVLVKEEFAKFN